MNPVKTLKTEVFKITSIYFSVYENKKDYTALIGGHIAKSILSYSGGVNYVSKVFIDKMDKRTIESIKKEIRSFRIKYKNITGVKEESNQTIRLADALCGLIRDLENKNVPDCYKKVFDKLKKI